MKWYARDPNAALIGMSSLTLEERGAYTTILDLIYAHDGAIKDNDRFLAGWCDVHVKVWKRIRAKLIAENKLYVNGPTLRNARADWVIDAAQQKASQAADAARSKHRKSRADSKGVKDLADASAERSHCESRIQNKNLTSSLQSIPPRAREGRSVQESADGKAASGASAELIALSLRKGWVQ